MNESQCKCKDLNEPCYIKDGLDSVRNNRCIGTNLDTICINCERTVREILKEETIAALEIFITDWQLRADDLESDLGSNKSSELTKAINLLERWKEQ